MDGRVGWAIIDSSTESDSLGDSRIDSLIEPLGG